MKKNWMKNLKKKMMNCLKSWMKREADIVQHQYYMRINHNQVSHYHNMEVHLVDI